MSITRQFRRVIKNIVFGDVLIPQAFTIGLAEPQTEVAVWLHGMGEPIDVTYCHSVACADPLTICISFEKGWRPNEIKNNSLSLIFCERDGQMRILGNITLNIQKAESVPTIGSELVLFEVRNSANYCLPVVRTLIYYVLHRYLLWRKVDVAGIKMSFLERRALMVTFIRPHPVVLVSLVTGAGGNIFPMNIMGELAGGYFAFALKNSRLAARLVERAGVVALGDVPLSQTSLAYRLGINHGRQSINWEELPFVTKSSTKLGIPVPAFSHRVRELEIESSRDLGSHTFFVARVIHEERYAEVKGLFIVHGFYQAWRLRERREELKISLADDLYNKRGTPFSSLPL